MNWQRITLISLFVLATIGFCFVLWFFFFKPIFFPEPVVEPIVNINENNRLPQLTNIDGQLIAIDPETQLPISGETNINTGADGQSSPVADGGLTNVQLLTEGRSLFSTLGPNGRMIYYNPDENKFYRVSADGTVNEYSSQLFHDVENVTWSNNSDMAIMEYPDGSKIIYDFSSNEQHSLPSHWIDFSFSPSDQKIAFKSMGLDVENRFLTISDINGSKAKALERLGTKEDQFQVNWSPNNQMVGTFIESKDLDRSEIYFVGLNNENFRLMVVEGRDFRAKWSPQGDKMIYSVYNSNNDYKPQLWVVDATANTIGNNRRSIGLETWGDKCAFYNNETIYCAVPKEMPYGAGVESGLNTTLIDDIYEINLRTGARTLIAVPNGQYNISNIHTTENHLFFTNNFDEGLYKLNLK